MTNFEISRTLSRVAKVLSFKGVERKRITDIKILSMTVEGLPFELNRKSLERVEKYLLNKSYLKRILRDLVVYGKSEEIEILLRDVPPSLLELTRIPGVGGRTLKILYERFGVVDIYGLESVLKDGLLSRVKEIGLNGEEIIKKNINKYFKLKREFSLSTAESLFRHIKGILINHGAKRVEIAGSVRRKKEIVSNLNIVCEVENPTRFKKNLKGDVSTIKFIAKGDHIEFLYGDCEIPIKLLVVPKDYFGSALLFFTGPRNFSNYLISKGKDYGYKTLPPGYLWIRGDEKEILNILGMRYIPPEVRERWKEYLDMNGLLSNLNIKGDLHVHTNYSDGISSIYEVVSFARDMGYKYIGISDHTKDLKVVNGLNEKRLMNERLEVRKLQSKFPEIKILFGAEVNIRQDGSLDIEESALRELDFVIASIHYGFYLDREINTKRMIKAIRNPYVSIIGHPTGRKIGERERMNMRYDLIFKEAERTGTIIEVNATNDRLDIDSNMAYDLRNREVLFSIGSDAHFAPQLHSLSNFGVFILRRALVSENKVINTFNLNHLLEVLGRKRRSFNKDND